VTLSKLTNDVHKWDRVLLLETYLHEKADSDWTPEYEYPQHRSFLRALFMNVRPSLKKVQRIRHTTKRRLLEVRRVERISPGFVSVALGGPDLDGFTSLSFDDHIKLFLTENTLAGNVPPPSAGAQEASSQNDHAVMRDFTPRSFDPGKLELILEFALHGEGAATAWAAQAAPGQRLSIGGPRGSFVIPMDYDWHLLIGDETALPGIARRLEELPAGANVFAFIQLNDPADRRVLKTKARLVENWTGTSPDALVQAIRDFKLPAGEGFAWAAGEAKVIAAVRAILVEHGLDKDHIRAAAYWKHGTRAHHETFAD
jgi:NADPH-dependent ferric siderophore reductase